MTAYYNEFDPHAAAWLRNLIAAGVIAPGDVDERSIEDVTPNRVLQGCSAYGQATDDRSDREPKPFQATSCSQRFASGLIAHGLVGALSRIHDFRRRIRNCEGQTGSAGRNEHSVSLEAFSSLSVVDMSPLQAVCVGGILELTSRYLLYGKLLSTAIYCAVQDLCRNEFHIVGNCGHRKSSRRRAFCGIRLCTFRNNISGERVTVPFPFRTGCKAARPFQSPLFMVGL